MIKDNCQFYSEYHDMGCVLDYCSNYELGDVFDCEQCSLYVRKRETPYDYFTGIEKLKFERGSTDINKYFCSRCCAEFVIDIEPVYCPRCGKKRL